MRLWHYKLLPYLPKSQLLAQWRELNSIFRKQDKHILINYVYEHPREDLLTYTILVLREMEKRGISITSKSVDNYVWYFGKSLSELDHDSLSEPFADVMNLRYLTQCFYNLQEKYDRGQKDFGEKEYDALVRFMLSVYEKEGLLNETIYR